MRKSKIIILFIIALVSNKLNAQVMMIDLCEGITNHNFAIPFTSGSIYQWQVHGPLGIATIRSGNGTEHIKVDLNNPGVFKLIVYETDVNGCLGSDSILVEVHPHPKIDFTFSGNCIENATQFIDHSTIVADSLVNYLWNFGDGQLGNGSSIFHHYQTTGFYNVDLSVTSSFGCTDSITKSIQILPKPIAEFSYNPLHATIINPVISFTNENSNLTPIIWDFNDSNFSVLDNPIHEFLYPGKFDVMLVVIDSNSCIDSIEHPINIFYEFLLYTPNSFTPNNDGDNDIFMPKGYRMDKYETYQFIIYNKWGEIVFETKRIGEPWYGNNVQSGVYTWVIILTDEIGIKRKKVGKVNLLR